MKLFVYSVYDRKAALHAQPFFTKSEADAIRSFEEAVADPSTPLHKWPEDFSLRRLGDFDEASGEFTKFETVEILNAAGVLARLLERRPRAEERLPFPELEEGAALSERAAE